jgi:hypothetical protein
MLARSRQISGRLAARTVTNQYVPAKSTVSACPDTSVTVRGFAGKFTFSDVLTETVYVPAGNVPNE